MKVYFLSGVGADERVFRHIVLPNGFDPVYIPWCAFHKDETLQSYAKKLAASIDPSQKFAIVGLSFGGMLAIEIAKLLPVEKIILLSSIPSSTCLPGYYKFAGKLKLHRITPISWIGKAAVIKRFFSAETKEDKSIILNMIRNMDPPFIRWALDAIINWKSTTIPPNIYHIHGSSDKLLPMSRMKPTHVVRKAGHMMVMTHAREVNAVLREIFLSSEL